MMKDECELIKDPMKGDIEEEKTESKKETLAEMVTLLRDWVFMMFAVSNFLTSLGYPIPYTFVPVRFSLLTMTR